MRKKKNKMGHIGTQGVLLWCGHSYYYYEGANLIFSQHCHEICLNILIIYVFFISFINKTSDSALDELDCSRRAVLNSMNRIKRRLSN